MDSLLYSYDGNRLRKVNDQVTAFTPNHFPKNDQNHSLTAHYTYDGNGNATSDVNRNATLSYNHLNLPSRITVGTGWTDYVYDATGLKLRRVVQTGTTVNYDYIGGIEYEAGVLKRIPMSEGYIEALPNGSFEYRYALKDHLGNTRVVVAQTGTVLQRNHYYPFGLSIASLDFSGPGASWKYQYNGKEKQTELGLNWYDYGARQYDPALGRWHSVDKLAGNYRSVSPFVYSINNPALFTDPNGLEVKNAHEKEREKASEKMIEKEKAFEKRLADKGLSEEKLATMTKKEKEAAGFNKEDRKAQKERDKARDNFDEANKNWHNANQDIAELKHNDPELFTKIDNLSFDVYVGRTSSTSISSDPAFTAYGSSATGEPNARIADGTGNLEVIHNAVNVTLRNGWSGNAGARLAHEFGHVEDIAYMGVAKHRQMERGVNCQENPSHPSAANAMRRESEYRSKVRQLGENAYKRIPY